MDQSQIIDALMCPALYGLPEECEIQRVDTHISIVFLAGDRAYKLKRAVCLPFVDFRKREDRLYFAERELDVNRLFAPGLYEKVQTLYFQEPSGFNFSKQGKPVEHLVCMKRFSQSDMFDHLCETGELSFRDMELLSDHIYESYLASKISTEYGGAEGLKRAFKGHFKAFENCPKGVLSPEKLCDLKELARGHLAIYHDHLEDRRKEGFVRHCHGDLHLRNIAHFKGEVILFDAIEFEPDYAIIDVLYDLSFLLMDLCHRGRADLANIVLNRFVGRSGDAPGLHLLGIFQASRAAIRSHVSAVASANQPELAKREAMMNEARLYLDEALEYFNRQKPCLIAIGGLSATGKSRLSRALAPDLGPLPGALIARTDMIRKRLMKTHPEDTLPKEAYGLDMSNRTYHTLYVEAHFALHAGLSVIVDGVFSKAEERAKLTALA